MHGLAADRGVPVDPRADIFLSDPWRVLTSVRDRRRGLKTLLHAAAEGGNLSLLALLLPRASAADLVARDGSGATPMHYAAQEARMDVLD